MSVNQWVLKFRDLHERFRAGKLDDIDRRVYFADREQFAKALLNAQGLSMEAGQSARRSFRIAQGMQMDLSFNSGTVRCMTLDVSCGGFSVMMHQPPPEQEQPGFNLRLPGGLDPLVGRARYVSAQRKIGTHRVSFSFVDLPAKDMERLETVLFDIALERLKG
jgi:hypothetical protein